MTKQEFQKLTENHVLLLDGATGSNLMKAGMPRGVCTESWVLEHKDVIQSLQKAYIEAGSQLNKAKEILAFELTKMVHGEEEAKKAEEASKALFAGGGDDSNMPTSTITPDQLTDGGIGIMDLMVTCGLAGTKSEARRLVQQGGVSVNDEKVSDIGFVVTESMLKEGAKIKKGKKKFHKAIMD